jgi:CHAT domain-containing protein/Flp pilus assembly protein TadD
VRRTGCASRSRTEGSETAGALIRGLAPGVLLLLSLGCGGRGKTAPVAPVPAVPPPVLRVTVQAGDYVHAVADQGAREVSLTLSDPQGHQLLQADSLTAEAEPNLPAEEIHWVADAPGEIRVALKLLAGPPCPCGLRLAEHRPATAADRERALAEAELARAHGLRRTREPKACRAGVAVYESAQRRFADLGLPRREAEPVLGLADLQRKCLGDDATALQTLTRAESLFAGNPAFEAKARGNRGELSYRLGDLDGAMDDDRRALELRHQLGNRLDEALAANDLGVVLDIRGRYDEAAARFDHALDLWRPEDGPGRKAQVLLNRGYLYRELGEAGLAGERFQEALTLFHQANDRDNEAAALNALGSLAWDAGQPSAALKPFQNALALRPPGSHGRAVTLVALGAVYRALGRPEDARKAYTEACPLFLGPGNARGQASCLGDLGRLEGGGTGQEQTALGHLDRAAGLFRALDDPPGLAWALEGKARVLSSGGRLEAARGLMEQALTAVERYRLSQASYNTRASFFATQQDLYDFLVDLLVKMRREGEALEINERSLARSLLDGLAAGGADLHPSGADPEQPTREREIEKEIDALVARQTRLSRDETTPPAQLKAVEEELGRHWNDLDRVRAALRTDDPRYAALTQPQPWKAADVQRRLLGPDTLLLEYRLGESRSLLWAVTPASLQVFVLPGRAEIEHAARAGSWSRRGDETAANLQLARLGRMLLDPVARLLPGKKRLLIVGDGILQLLPFAALPEPGIPEPLVARHEIVTLPSVSVLGELRQDVARRPRAPKALWVLANPDFGRDRAYEPLPYTREEAAAILDLVPAAGRVEVEGRAASREAVLDASLRDFRLLHFATHHTFTANDPGGGRLVLAQVGPDGREEPNGFLHLADIYQLSLRADLVVLSACRSALGKEVRGEGMMGMTRGFFYAGAERVLVSLWNVNDGGATVELMRHFYQGMLQEGLPPAAALREAQDWVRRQQRWQAPYYWAGFTLQGEWQGEPQEKGPKGHKGRKGT